MKKTIAVLIVLFALGASIPSYFWIKTSSILSETRIEKIRVSQELETTEKMLATTKETLDKTKGILATTRKESNTIKQELLVAGQKIASLDQTLEKTRQEITDYETTLKTLIPQKNPTYQELKDFLVKDGTNLMPYIPGEYVCLDFTTALDNAAEKAGIRAGYVFLTFRFMPEGKWGHTLNAFETSDRGLIYIEPQNDEEVKIEVGLQYIETIQEIMIAW